MQHGIAGAPAIPLACNATLIPEPPMADVVFSAVSKSYGDVGIIRSLDLTIKSGEFTVLLGPSGCGKTTLLRMVAGLEEVTDGGIAIDGRDVTDLHASDRDIAMVFQSYALYPHLDVAGNIGFPLSVRGLPKSEVDAKVREIARVLGLEEYLGRKPKQLSGGQRQRVALGRAMVRQPKVFLFDEPLSNLDASMREEMRSELIRFHRTLGKTLIYVTHDQVEAMTMAQRIIVMRGGAIQQIGTPREVYKSPANAFVAQFIGSPSMNLLSFGEGSRLGGAPVRFSGMPAPAKGALVGFRPENVSFKSEATDGMTFRARVTALQPLGATMIVDLVTADEGKPITAVTEWRDDLLSPNQEVKLSLNRQDLHYFDSASLNRIH
jgi:ABC-type sugar transport system ATPase subunit